MVIYGSEIAENIKVDLKKEIETLKAEGKRTPKLSVILVGENPASLSYIKGKRKACEFVGIEFNLVTLAEDAGQAKLIETILSLNNDTSVDGILVQLPLPSGYDYEEKVALELIAPSKDVDGLTSYNAGKLFLGEDGFAPCTPLGIMEILKSANVDLNGKDVCVIGRSNLVGLPVMRLLVAEHATVTLCHSRTIDLKEKAKRADVLIVAVGKPKYIDESYVKEQAVVIDVGINRVDGHLCGDVDFERVKDHCSIITPVPKGCGPMTIAMLLKNVLKAYYQRG